MIQLDSRDLKFLGLTGHSDQNYISNLQSLFRTRL